LEVFVLSPSAHKPLFIHSSPDTIWFKNPSTAEKPRSLVISLHETRQNDANKKE